MKLQMQLTSLMSLKVEKMIASHQLQKKRSKLKLLKSQKREKTLMKMTLTKKMVKKSKSKRKMLLSQSNVLLRDTESFSTTDLSCIASDWQPELCSGCSSISLLAS